MKKLSKIVSKALCLCIVLALVSSISLINATQAKELKDIVIGYVLMSRTTEFLVAEEIGAKMQAEELGIELILLDGENSSTRQLACTEDLITLGVDAIVLNPYDSGGIIPAVKACNEAGIPCVTVDSIAAGGEVDFHVGFDNAESGRRSARYILAELKKKNQAKGVILELHGPLGAWHAQRRHQGFIEVMKEHPEYKIITIECPDWGSDAGYRATVNTLTAHPDLLAINAGSDNMLIGAIPALQAQGKLFPIGHPKHIPNTGVDGAWAALEFVRKGHQDVSYCQDPVWQAMMAVLHAVYMAQGRDLGVKWVEQFPLDVTQENVDYPGLWANQVPRK